MATMDYDSYLAEFWGWGNENLGILTAFSLASNVLIGSNPPYSASDFLTLYPQFGGVTVPFTVTTDGTTAVLMNVSSVTGLSKGVLVAGPGIPDGATVLSVDGTAATVTLNQNTTAAASDVSVTAWPTPLVSLTILNAYIALATASLMQLRYQELWAFVMGLYVAHFVTLWLQSFALGPLSTQAQVATAGLALIVKTSKSAGDVSVSGQAIVFDDWGSYNLTIFGQQFIGFAKAIGSGNMMLY